MLRIAVLGAGSHSSGTHGPALRLCKQKHRDQVELAAVCDLRRDAAEAYAEKFGFEKVYEDLDAMLAEEKLDGLVAVTPIAATAEIVARLLPSKLPLLIEKPPGANSAENRRLMEIAEEHRAPHMVSYNRRFNPAVVAGRRWLEENAADRPIQFIAARMFRHSRREETFVTGTGIHLIDTVQSFLGAALSVDTRKLSAAGGAARIWDARITCAGGAAHLRIAPECGVLEETYELLGEDYNIQIDGLHCRVRVFDRRETALDWAAPDDADPSFKGGTFGETEAFIHAIRSGEGFRPNLRDALAVMRTAEAIDAGGEAQIGA